MARYNGFTCPQCGGHFFSTSSYPDTPSSRFDEKLVGKKIGRCQTPIGDTGHCTHTWDRGIPEQEDECMYTQTREEWMGEEPAPTGYAVLRVKRVTENVAHPHFALFADDKIIDRDREGYPLVQRWKRANIEI